MRRAHPRPTSSRGGEDRRGAVAASGLTTWPPSGGEDQGGSSPRSRAAGKEDTLPNSKEEVGGRRWGLERGELTKVRSSLSVCACSDLGGLGWVGRLDRQVLGPPLVYSPQAPGLSGGGP